MTEREPSITTPIEPIEPATPGVPVAPVVVATRKPSSGRWLNLLLGVAAVLAVGGVAFAIGRSTAPAASFPTGAFPDGAVIARPNGSFDPGGAGGGPAGPGFLGAGGGLTMEGTVSAIDADSITVTLGSGEEMTFDLDDGTTYHDATETDAAAVAVGDQVAVQASGGRLDIGGGSNGTATSPSLTAGDVTVRR
jgi:hypothetical protein